MHRVTQGASPAAWANMKDVIMKIWKERAKSAKDLVDILREEHNFITTKNMWYKTKQRWDQEKDKESRKESEQNPQKKRKRSQISTGDGDKRKPCAPAQSILASVQLRRLQPNIQTLEVDKESKLILYSIDQMKDVYLEESKFYLTRTGVKVRVTTQEQFFAVYQGWPQTWLGLGGLYNALGDDWQRLRESGRDEEILALREKATEVIYEGLRVFVRALNGYMPNEQKSCVKFCDFFFRVMLTNIWPVCFRILDHNSTQPEYSIMFLTDFLIKFRELVYTELYPYHPLTRMLTALCQVPPKHLRQAVCFAASLTVRGMVGDRSSNSVISFWQGTLATIPISH